MKRKYIDRLGLSAVIVCSDGLKENGVGRFCPLCLVKFNNICKIGGNIVYRISKAVQILEFPSFAGGGLGYRNPRSPCLNPAGLVRCRTCGWLLVRVTADRCAILSVHRCCAAGAGDPVPLCQLAGAADARRQPVPGHLQPALRADAHHTRSCRAVHHRRLAHVGCGRCTAVAAHPHDPLQRRTSCLHQLH